MVSLLLPTSQQSKEAILNSISDGTERKRRKRKDDKDKPKEKKISTSEQTYNLFKTGKNIEENCQRARIDTRNNTRTSRSLHPKWRDKDRGCD